MTIDLNVYLYQNLVDLDWANRIKYAFGYELTFESALKEQQKLKEAQQVVF